MTVEHGPPQQNGTFPVPVHPDSIPILVTRYHERERQIQKARRAPAPSIAVPNPVSLQQHEHTVPGGVVQGKIKKAAQRIAFKAGSERVPGTTVQIVSNYSSSPPASPTRRPARVRKQGNAIKSDILEDLRASINAATAPKEPRHDQNAKSSNNAKQQNHSRVAPATRTKAPLAQVNDAQTEATTEKRKPYDPDEVRDFMRKQKRQRKLQVKEELPTPHKHDRKKPYDEEKVKAYMQRKLEELERQRKEKEEEERRKTSQLQKRLENLDQYRRRQGEAIKRRVQSTKASSGLTFQNRPDAGTGDGGDRNQLRQPKDATKESSEKRQQSEGNYVLGTTVEQGINSVQGDSASNNRKENAVPPSNIVKTHADRVRNALHRSYSAPTIRDARAVLDVHPATHILSRVNRAYKPSPSVNPAVEIAHEHSDSSAPKVTSAPSADLRRIQDLLASAVALKQRLSRQSYETEDESSATESFATETSVNSTIDYGRGLVGEKSDSVDNINTQLSGLRATCKRSRQNYDPPSELRRPMGYVRGRPPSGEDASVPSAHRPAEWRAESSSAQGNAHTHEASFDRNEAAPTARSDRSPPSTPPFISSVRREVAIKPVRPFHPEELNNRVALGDSYSIFSVFSRRIGEFEKAASDVLRCDGTQTGESQRNQSQIPGASEIVGNRSSRSTGSPTQGEKAFASKSVGTVEQPPPSVFVQPDQQYQQHMPLATSTIDLPSMEPDSNVESNRNIDNGSFMQRDSGGRDDMLHLDDLADTKLQTAGQPRRQTGRQRNATSQTGTAVEPEQLNPLRSGDTRESPLRDVGDVSPMPRDCGDWNGTDTPTEDIVSAPFTDTSSDFSDSSTSTSTSKDSRWHSVPGFRPYHHDEQYPLPRPHGDTRESLLRRSRRLSPHSLSRKLIAEMNLLEAIQNSHLQLTDLERTKQSAIAQGNTVALVRALQEKERQHEKELAEARRARELQESHLGLDKSDVKAHPDVGASGVNLYEDEVFEDISDITPRPTFTETDIRIDQDLAMQTANDMPEDLPEVDEDIAHSISEIVEEPFDIDRESEKDEYQDNASLPEEELPVEAAETEDIHNATASEGQARLKPTKFATMSVHAIQDFLEKERNRFRDQEAYLNLRENTLEDQVRSEIELLRQQRVSGGSAKVNADVARALQDREHAVRMRYALEKAEIEMKRKTLRESSSRRIEPAKRAIAAKKLLKRQSSDANHIHHSEQNRSRHAREMNEVSEHIGEGVPSPSGAISEDIVGTPDEPESFSEALENESHMDDISEDVPDEESTPLDQAYSSDFATSISPSISGFSLSTPQTDDSETPSSSIHNLVAKLHLARRRVGSMSELEREQRQLETSRRIAEGLLRKQKELHGVKARLKKQKQSISRILDEVMEHGAKKAMSYKQSSRKEQLSIKQDEGERTYTRDDSVVDEVESNMEFGESMSEMIDEDINVESGDGSLASLEEDVHSAAIPSGNLVDEDIKEDLVPADDISSFHAGDSLQEIDDDISSFHTGPRESISSLGIRETEDRQYAGLANVPNDQGGSVEYADSFSDIAEPAERSHVVDDAPDDDLVKDESFEMMQRRLELLRRQLAAKQARAKEIHRKKLEKLRQKEMMLKRQLEALDVVIHREEAEIEELDLEEPEVQQDVPVSKSHNNRSRPPVQIPQTPANNKSPHDALAYEAAIPSAESESAPSVAAPVESKEQLQYEDDEEIQEEISDFEADLESQGEDRASSPSIAGKAEISPKDDDLYEYRSDSFDAFSETDQPEKEPAQVDVEHRDVEEIEEEISLASESSEILEASHVDKDDEPSVSRDMADKEEMQTVPVVTSPLQDGPKGLETEAVTIPLAEPPFSSETDLLYVEEHAEPGTVLKVDATEPPMTGQDETEEDSAMENATRASPVDAYGSDFEDDIEEDIQFDESPDAQKEDIEYVGSFDRPIELAEEQTHLNEEGGAQSDDIFVEREAASIEVGEVEREPVPCIIGASVNLEHLAGEKSVEDLREDIDKVPISAHAVEHEDYEKSEVISRHASAVDVDDMGPKDALEEHVLATLDQSIIDVKLQEPKDIQKSHEAEGALSREPSVIIERGEATEKYLMEPVEERQKMPAYTPVESPPPTRGQADAGVVLKDNTEDVTAQLVEESLNDAMEAILAVANAKRPPTTEALRYEEEQSKVEPTSQIPATADAIVDTLLDEMVSDAVAEMQVVYFKRRQKPALPVLQEPSPLPTKRRVPAPPPPPPPRSGLAADFARNLLNSRLLPSDRADGRYITAPILSRDALESLLSGAGNDNQLENHLFFDATNEAIAELFSEHDKYYQGPRGKVSGLPPRPLTREQVVTGCVERVRNWAKYSEDHGENLDTWLIVEIKEAEKAWVRLDQWEEGVKEKVFMAIWEDLLEDTVNCIGRVCK